MAQITGFTPSIIKLHNIDNGKFFEHADDASVYKMVNKAAGNSQVVCLRYSDPGENGGVQTNLPNGNFGRVLPDPITDTIDTLDFSAS